MNTNKPKTNYIYLNCELAGRQHKAKPDMIVEKNNNNPIRSGSLQR